MGGRLEECSQPLKQGASRANAAGESDVMAVLRADDREIGFHRFRALLCDDSAVDDGQAR